jgi:uncharacterized protein (TIGR03000 family)
MVLVAGWLFLSGSAAGQGYYRPYIPPTYILHPYASGAFPGSELFTYYPLAYTTRNGTAIPTYPPSINYPAFYAPSYNFLNYGAASNLQIPRYTLAYSPPTYSAAFYNPSTPGFVTPVTFAGLGALNTDLAAAQVSAHNFPSALNAAYTAAASYAAPASFAAPASLATPAYAVQGAAVSPLDFSPTVAAPIISYAPPIGGFNLAPSAATSSSQNQTYETKTSGTKEDTKETRVRRSNGSTALIDLAVVPDAEVWFQGVKTRQTGELRRFTSPPLARGQAFTYNIRVRWTANGKSMTRTHRLAVRAGDWWRVDLTSASDASTTMRVATAAP